MESGEWRGERGEGRVESGESSIPRFSRIPRIPSTPRIPSIPRKILNSQFSILNYFPTFVVMKANINWKHFLVLFIVIGGLYYITHSLWITGGIMAILLLIDGLLMQYEHRKRGEREIEEITRKLKDEKED